MARRRCTVARETPNAAQTGALMRLAGASATTAAVRARRRWMPVESPATPQLFLHVDDSFRTYQAPRQAAIFAPQESKFASLRVGFGGLGAALDRTQRADGPGVAKLAPIGQRRRIDALAAQDRANTTAIGGAIGLGQDAQLVLRGESPSARAIGQLGRRRGRRRYNRRPLQAGRNGSGCCLSLLREHGHDPGNPSGARECKFRGVKSITFIGTEGDTEC